MAAQQVDPVERPTGVTVVQAAQPRFLPRPELGFRPGGTVFLARSGSIGSTAWTSARFTGDQERSWDAERGIGGALRSMLSGSLSGWPYWGPDIGGWNDPAQPVHHDSNDWVAWACDDQFLPGKDILVAPVLHSGVRRRPVYLPAGDWVDFWTSARSAGRSWVHVDARVRRIPLFVRAGSDFVLPLPTASSARPDNDRIPSMQLDKHDARAQDGGVVTTEHGAPAVGGLLDVPWSGRRENAFDEWCQRA